MIKVTLFADFDTKESAKHFLDNRLSGFPAVRIAEAEYVGATEESFAAEQLKAEAKAKEDAAKAKAKEEKELEAAKAAVKDPAKADKK
jgi:hypothetical protein